MNWGEKEKLFSKYGIPTVKTKVIKGLKEALEAYEELEKPLVLKTQVTSLGHRTEKGNVITGIENKAELKKSFKKLGEAGKLLLQERLEGRELIIGGKVDRAFGPVVMFGLGGVFTEVYEDVVFRVAPISKREAGKMIQEIRGYKILGKFRGKEEVNISLLKEVVSNVSKMLSEENIETLDINPFIINSEGGAAVDIKLRELE